MSGTFFKSVNFTLLLFQCENNRYVYYKISVYGLDGTLRNICLFLGRQKNKVSYLIRTQQTQRGQAARDPQDTSPLVAAAKEM